MEDLNPYQSPATKAPRTKRWGKRSPMLLPATGISLVCHAIASGNMLTLMAIPPGSSIRPMGHTALAVVVGVFAFIGGGIASMVALTDCTGRWRILAVLVLLSNAMVIPASILTLQAIAVLLNLSLED